MRPYVAAAAALAIATLFACSRAPARGDDRSGMASGTSSGSSGGNAPAPAPAARVIVHGSAGPAPVTVEVVKSRGLVQRGLMYRKFLPPEAGMLFLMGDDDDHYFWMKNTLIALDIIFIKSDMTVAGVLENMQPHDTNSKGVGVPSRYVLEVNAGWARVHGVGPGTRISFEGVEAAAR